MNENIGFHPALLLLILILLLLLHFITTAVAEHMTTQSQKYTTESNVKYIQPFVETFKYTRNYLLSYGNISLEFNLDMDYILDVSWKVTNNNVRPSDI